VPGSPFYLSIFIFPRIAVYRWLVFTCYIISFVNDTRAIIAHKLWSGWVSGRFMGGYLLHLERPLSLFFDLLFLCRHKIIALLRCINIERVTGVLGGRGSG
jgi:hypothetical protein